MNNLKQQMKLNKKNLKNLRTRIKRGFIIPIIGIIFSLTLAVISPIGLLTILHGVLIGLNTGTILKLVKLLKTNTKLLVIADKINVELSK